MTARESAYQALGLKPGASRAEVDEAYRRLIKQHHPDRAGGDSQRAADVNRAYTFLRQQRLAVGPQSRPLPVVVQPRRRPRSRWSDRLFAAVVLGIVVAGGAAMYYNDGNSRFAHALELPSSAADSEVHAAPARAPIDFDQPLNLTVVDSAVAQAISFHLANDVPSAEIYSRDCQANLRRQPNLVWFDACAAFDEATIALSSDAELADSGIFNQSAVIAREVVAARALTADVLVADSRLHQIRSRVEQRLLTLLDSTSGQPL